MWMINLAFVAAVGPLYGYGTDLFYPAKYRALAGLVPHRKACLQLLTATMRVFPLLGRRLEDVWVARLTSVPSANPSAPYVCGHYMQRTACLLHMINWCSAL